MYSTAPHGDVRREIAHNAPPLVFHKKWNSNKKLSFYHNRGEYPGTRSL